MHLTLSEGFPENHLLNKYTTLVEITFLYIVKEIQILIKYYSSKTKCPNEASQKKTSNNLCSTDTDTRIGIGRIRIRGYIKFLQKLKAQKYIEVSDRIRGYVSDT